MHLKQEIIGHKNKVPAILLGVFFLVAGLSKFVMLELWMGYEPRILINMLPVASREITVAGGALETLIGAGLLLRERTKYFSAAATAWMAAITVQVARLQLYDIAIRDVGLFFYALSVLIYELDTE
jgi:uncharacterized membrane protein